MNVLPIEIVYLISEYFCTNINKYIEIISINQQLYDYISIYEHNIVKRIFKNPIKLISSETVNIKDLFDAEDDIYNIEVYDKFGIYILKFSYTFLTYIELSIVWCSNEKKYVIYHIDIEEYEIFNKLNNNNIMSNIFGHIAKTMDILNNYGRLI